MAESTTLTVRLPTELKAQLAKLAGHTKRKQSFLGMEAIAAYVARGLAIVEAIERGRADVKAGRYVSNDEAFRQVDEIIETARIPQ